jgi:alginate O-acetyltransferase complex protein AlgI
MGFSSPNFVFLFLPLAIAICLSCRSRCYLVAIFVVSIIFYFWSAGGYALVLLGIIFLNFAGALAAARSGTLFVCLVVANVCVLLVFKYAAFVSHNVDVLIGTQSHAVLGSIVLPAGISFFVFQAISYLVDVRRGDIPAERRLSAYGAYQSFFPHLIAGPIVRFRDVIADINAPKLSVENFSCGVTRFAHGLFKKVVIADNVAPIANSVFALPSGDVDFATGWIGAIAFAIQIYFDFSGYSDMAIGMAQMFGIRFHENFERPYASKSITEFWRRWHISLSTWFRDYVYIPLGGSRGGQFATYRNLLIVFTITGLWHGAAWTFMVWGLYHGAFIILERMVCRAPAVEALRAPALRWLYCLPVIIFGWVVFRASTIDQSLDIWTAMLSPTTWPTIELVVQRAALTPYTAAALAAGMVIFLLPGTVSLGKRMMKEPVLMPMRIANLVYTSAALITASLIVLSGSYSPFLYFTF